MRRKYRCGTKQAKWLKSYKARLYRRTIRNLVNIYCKEIKGEDYYKVEIHLPLVKDLYDSWAWD